MILFIMFLFRILKTNSFDINKQLYITDKKLYEATWNFINYTKFLNYDQYVIINTLYLTYE